MVKVEVYKAIDHFPECKEFIIGHRKVLQIFDIANITSASLEWAFSPSSTIILIRRTDNNKLIGGARLQRSDPKLALPMEDAVTEIDSTIHEYIIDKENHGGVAEICGLWNTREGAKLGVGSKFLTRAVFAVAIQLEIKSVVMLCAPSTVNMAINIGCDIIDTLGDSGKFYYPKLDLIATTMIKKNMFDLSNLVEEEREYISDLLKNPVQIKKSINKKGQMVEVDYNLIVQ